MTKTKIPNHLQIKSACCGEFSDSQWLRLWLGAFTDRGLSSIPGQGTQILLVMLCSKKKKSQGAEQESREKTHAALGSMCTKQPNTF